MDAIFETHSNKMKETKLLTADDKDDINELIYCENMTPSEAIKYVTDKKEKALIEKLNNDFFNLIGIG